MNNTSTKKILHITPHLGGGIGKVLYGLVKQSIKTKSKNKIEHQIICLEQPEKLQFIDKINECNKNIVIDDEKNVDEKRVVICPSTEEQEYLINNADIIQLELFDSRRQTLIKYLQNSNSSLNNLPIRLVTWYHNNGLYDNFLPYELVEKSHTFLFTSPCSFENKKLTTHFKDKIEEGNLNAVFSSGGFEDILHTSVGFNKYPLLIGCFKHLNPTKLHPDIDKYLKSLYVVEQTNEPSNFKHTIHPNIKIFKNFVPNIIDELKSINVIAYLLNPTHFGCSENLLLECMAMGIVPIVMNNPPEKYIVENEKNGLIINDINEFKDAIKFLHENPFERREIGLNASKSVRERFSIEKTEFELNYHYNRLLSRNKEKINLSSICYDKL